MKHGAIASCVNVHFQSSADVCIDRVMFDGPFVLFVVMGVRTLDPEAFPLETFCGGSDFALCFMADDDETVLRVFTTLA